MFIPKNGPTKREQRQSRRVFVCEVLLKSEESSDHFHRSLIYFIEDFRHFSPKA
jgi:hypothetical protein